MNTRGGRILAIEVRTYRIGIVALHETGTLMEWGVWHYRGSANRDAWIANKLSESIVLHTPALILLRRRRWRRRRSSFASATVSTVHRIARRRSISVRVVPAWEITSYFRGRGYRNKRMIGEFLTCHFNELSAKLPRHRKPGEPERHNAVIFDALATAVAVSCCDRSGAHAMTTDSDKSSDRTGNSAGLWPDVKPFLGPSDGPKAGRVSRDNRDSTITPNQAAAR